MVTVHCCACWGAGSCPADISHFPTCSAAESEIRTFDYSLPAELDLAKRGAGQRKRLQCRCFPTAAEAIRFAVEDFPSVRRSGRGRRSAGRASTAKTSSAATTVAVIPCAVEHLEVHPPSERLAQPLQQPQTEPRVDDLLGLRNDVLFAAFLKISRAVAQWRGRAPRIDGHPPAFADRADLKAIASIFYNIRH